MSSTNTWPDKLRSAIQIAAPGERWSYVDLAVGGASTTTRAAAIDADLAAYSSAQTPVQCVLVNLGVNDIGETESTFKTNMAYIVDAYHVKFPLADVYITKVWRRGYDTACDTKAGWIDDLVADRAGWCFVGVDERGAGGIESTDDGATYTTDGVHYSDTGQTLVANLWKTVLGY